MDTERKYNSELIQQNLPDSAHSFLQNALCKEENADYTIAAYSYAHFWYKTNQDTMPRELSITFIHIFELALLFDGNNHLLLFILAQFLGYHQRNWISENYLMIFSAFTYYNKQKKGKLRPDEFNQDIELFIRQHIIDSIPPSSNTNANTNTNTNTNTTNTTHTNTSTNTNINTTIRSMNTITNITTNNNILEHPISSPIYSSVAMDSILPLSPSVSLSSSLPRSFIPETSDPTIIMTKQTSSNSNYHNHNDTIVNNIDSSGSSSSGSDNNNDCYKIDIPSNYKNLARFIDSKVCRYFEKAISIKHRLRYLSQYADWLEDLKYYARCKEICKQAIDIINQMNGNSTSNNNNDIDSEGGGIVAVAAGGGANNNNNNNNNNQVNNPNQNANTNQDRNDNSMPINNKTKYELHSQYARVCEKLHDLESAKHYMKQACEFMKFTKPNAIDEYLQTLLNLRDFDACQQLLDHLMSINPNNPDYIYFYSRYHFERGEYYECCKRMIRAIEIIEALGLETNEVKKLAPQHPKIKHPHLIAYHYTGTEDEERRPCKPYFDIDVFYRRYAFVAQKLLDLTLAEALIRKAIDLDPNYGYSFTVLGDVLKDQHKYDSAINSYRKALHLDPDDCTSYAEIARCYFLKGDMEQVKKYWNMALENDKDCKDLKFQYRWAGYLYWDNRFQEAFQKISYIIKKNKHQIGCYLLRAMIMKHYPDDYDIKDILFWFEKYYSSPYLGSISYYYCEYVMFLTDWGCEGDYDIIFTYFKDVVKHQVSYDLDQDDLYSLNMLQYAETAQPCSTYTSIEGHMKRVVDTWTKFEVTPQTIEEEEKMEKKEEEQKKEELVTTTSTKVNSREKSTISSSEEHQMDHQRNLHVLAKLGIATIPVTRLSKYQIHDKFQLECAYAHLLSVSGKIIQATKLFMKWHKVIAEFKLFPCNNPRGEWYFHHFYALHLHYRYDNLQQINIIDKPLQKAYQHYELALKYRSDNIEDLFHFAQLCVTDEFKEYQKAKDMLTKAYQIDKRVYVIQHGYEPLIKLIDEKLKKKDELKN